MGHVLVLANLKGGVGKTTTAMHLAAAAAQDGLRVLVVDADPQQSALAWAALAEDSGGVAFTVVAGKGRHAGTTARSMARDYDLTVVDTAPSEDSLASVRACMEVADLVIVPCSPTGLDVARVVRTVQLAEQVGVPTGVLVTKTSPRWVSHRELVEALSKLENVALLDAVVRFGVRVGETYGSTLRGSLGDYEAVWREIAAALKGT